LLADGHIQGHNFISMLELKEKYGNERQTSSKSDGQDDNTSQ
jgi:hypothetical protein